MNRIVCLALTSLLLLRCSRASRRTSNHSKRSFAKLTENSKTTTPPLKSFKTNTQKTVSFGCKSQL